MPASAESPFWTFLGTLVTLIFGLAGKAWFDNKRSKPKSVSLHEQLRSLDAKLDAIRDERAEQFGRIEATLQNLEGGMRRAHERMDMHLEGHP